METQSTALATREELNQIAAVDPSTAWLYSGGNRISINNDTRNGFILKGSEEQVSELRCVIKGIAPLHSHRQPNDKQRADGKPVHAEKVEWCESRNGKETSVGGTECGTCPANSNCAWKIELDLVLSGRDGSFLLTIPTVSSMRFKDAAQKVAKVHRLHFSQVAWRLWVAVEKSNGNSFPVVNFEAHDMQTGETLGDGPAKATAPANTAITNAVQLLAALGREVGDYYDDPEGRAVSILHLQGAIRKYIGNPKWGWPGPNDAEGWKQAHDAAVTYAKEQIAQHQAA